MTTLPTNRTKNDTPDEHVSDHNILHTLHDILDGSTVPSTGTMVGGVLKAGDTMTGQLAMPQLAGTGSAPAVAAGADIGLGSPVAPAITAASTNLKGTVNFVTGVNPAAEGVMVVLTFASPLFPNTPVEAEAVGGNRAALRDGPFIRIAPYGTDLSSTTLSIRLNNPQPNTPYQIRYVVL